MTLMPLDTLGVTSTDGIANLLATVLPDTRAKSRQITD